MIRPPRRDGAIDSATDSSADGAMDATSDAALPPGCFVAGLGTGTVANVVAEGVPFPFAVSRSFTTWDPALCSTETLLVGLTEGSCSPSLDTQLLFSLESASIGTSIFVGSNVLFAEPAVGLRVRFRVIGAGGGVEEWGTCAGSSGTIDFSSLDSVVGTRLTATYDMILTDCRAPLDSSPLSVTGSFDVPIEIAFETICL